MKKALENGVRNIKGRIPLIFGQLEELFEDKWYLNPEILENRIKEICGSYGLPIEYIAVMGETENITVYIFLKDLCIVFTPFRKVSKNPVVKRAIEKKILSKKLAVVYPSRELKKLRKEFETLPRIILINPYIPEKYPVPRLPLNIAILTSYLRKNQKARVWMLDTQLGLKVKEIVEEILRINPNIIGVSIPHGQTRLAVEILDEIYNLKRKKKWKGLVIIGNFIAASFPDYFLDRYPGIIVCRGEGENTISDLADFVKGRRKIEEVSGILTKKGKRVILTSVRPTNMNDLPLPALDTVEELIKFKGVLTHEWSRGCFWGKCTFCPRHHKPNHFKCMSSKKIIFQLKWFNKVMDKFPQLSRHLYTADEETIGGVRDSETIRLIKIAKGIIKNRIKINFDTYTRVDQIYNPRMSKRWHARRMLMWYLLKRAGLKRVFVGIESGSLTQLQRFGKGITPEQSVMAVRILTSLGIDVRIGFIMFDPLMNLNEIIENIQFLERKDAVMKEVRILRPTLTNFEKLFDALHRKEFVKRNKTGKLLCERVSYMLAQLEVLAGCNYLNFLRIAEKKYKKKLITGKPDLAIGKVKVNYLDSRVGLLARFSQIWIDKNFEVMYAIKGLSKVASPIQRAKLFRLMEAHRKLSLKFLKSMIWLVMKSKGCPWKISEIVNNKKYNFYILLKKPLRKRLKACLSIFLQIMKKEVVERALRFLNRNEIEDTEDGRLRKAIARWMYYNFNSSIIDE